MDNSPNLSIVTVSRNDNHNGNTKKRLNIFVRRLFRQLESIHLPSEILIVEWNPPRNKANLLRILQPIPKGVYCRLRIITIPSEIHNQFPNSSKVSLFQFIAKNVGIRRANGQFIIVTNMDIIFSNHLISKLAKKELEKSEFVRVLRLDIPDHLINSNVLKFDYLDKYAFRAFYPWGTENLQQNGKKFFLEDKYKNLINRLKLKKFIVLNKMYTNACGDFTLMSKQSWFQIRGYPEFPYHGVKIDGILHYQAISYGLKQNILSFDKCIYHLDHPGSWNQNTSQLLLKNLLQRKIPFLTNKKYQEIIQKIKKRKSHIHFNEKSWGLKELKLKEVV